MSVPYDRVDWLVIAEQAQPRLFDHWQVLARVIDHVDRDLCDMPRAGAGSGVGRPSGLMSWSITAMTFLVPRQDGVSDLALAPNAGWHERPRYVAVIGECAGFGPGGVVGAREYRWAMLSVPVLSSVKPNWYSWRTTRMSA